MHFVRMDIRSYERVGCPMILILTFLTILPSSTSYIDCRISCRRCHENIEHPSVLEVYCAMCEECKQRRRERMQGRSTTRTKGAVSGLVRMRDGIQASGEVDAVQTTSSSPVAAPAPAPLQGLSRSGQRQALQPPLTALNSGPQPRVQQPAYTLASVAWPPGCPTPPQCSDSEDEAVQLVVTDVPAQATTTTTTTTAPTPPPCPPMPSCMKKQKIPMMMPPWPGMMPGCMPCMPMCPCPMYTYPSPPPTTQQPATQMDYHYVYVGIPKNVFRRSGR